MLLAAEEILKKSESVSLASITEDGFPRICEMEKVVTDGLNHIYFVTLKSSDKVKHFRRNSKSSVCFSLDDDSVSLIGHIEIIETEDEKQRILPTEYVERLRKKGSSRYCILHFTTVEAKAFIDGTFATDLMQNKK